MRAPRQRDPLQAPRFSFRLVISGRSSNGASNVEVLFFNSHRQHAPDCPFSVAQVAIGAGGASPSWAERSRRRRHLAEVAKWDDSVLKDIGVSRQQALGKARKPFWRP